MTDNNHEKDDVNKNHGKINIILKKRVCPERDGPLDNNANNQKDSNDNNIKFCINKRYKYSCNNKKCDHKKYFTNWNEDNKISLKEINSLSDLINLADYYHCKMRRYFNGIDLKILYDIQIYLKELDNMIGLNNIKEEVVNMIMYLFINNNSKKVTSDMLNVVVTGVPGSGKTTFIEILAKIYNKLNILKNNYKKLDEYENECHIVKVKRSDLIGKYLGHTAVQTQKKIDEAYGGILLIDEAYSLGNPETRDSFSKECLDTLNQALSENRSNFICIIAGYKDALDSSFFSYNEGLRRRFPFRFDIEKYSYQELSRILFKKIEEHNIWSIKFKLEELTNIIKTNYSYFENQGGDMETLFLNIKIVHNKRVFLLEIIEKKDLLLNDINNATTKFLILKGDTLKKNILNKTLYGMYV